MQDADLTVHERLIVCGFGADLYKLHALDQLLIWYSQLTGERSTVDLIGLAKIGDELGHLMEVVPLQSLMVGRIIERHPAAVQTGLGAYQKNTNVLEHERNAVVRVVNRYGGAPSASAFFATLADAVEGDRPGVATEVSRLSRGDTVKAGFPSIACDIAGGLVFGGLATADPVLVGIGLAIAVAADC